MKALVAAAALLLAACTVAPAYRKPALDMPVAWKVEAPWREGVPADSVPKGNWWQRFGDDELDRLTQRALAANQSLAAANARLAQVRASLGVVSAGLFPQVSLSLRASNQRIAANRPLTRYSSPNESTIQDDLLVALGVSYEADLFGRIRSGVEGARASAEQSTADLENARLLVCADLATAYFALGSVDIELDVLARSIDLQRRALDYVGARHDLGAASGLDVAQQRALLDNTLTQVDLLRKTRAQFEHSIATLTGEPAPTFSLPVNLTRALPPPIPLGLPSDLLQRRPDIAAAERAMAAANAQIGVATAAFYPSFVIGPQLGFESTQLGTLIGTPSLLWAFGVSVLQPLFNAGRLQANLDLTRFGYEATVAGYRRTVLTAMQEVQDGITGTATLESAYAQAQRAIESARRVLDLATARYEGGVATYLDVITAQQGLLNAERQAAQLQGQRLLIAVFLFKALGGDWAS